MHSLRHTERYQNHETGVMLTKGKPSKEERLRHVGEMIMRRHERVDQHRLLAGPSKTTAQRLEDRVSALDNHSRQLIGAYLRVAISTSFGRGTTWGPHWVI